MNNRSISESVFSRKMLIGILLFILSIHSYCQVTIGSLDPPQESALLELKIENNDKGMLLPRVALTDIFDNQTIKNPATGLWIFNTADSDPENVPEADRVRKNHFYYWSENRWHELIGNNQIMTTFERIFSSMGIARPALFVLDGKSRVYNTTYPDLLGVLDPLYNVPINSGVDLPFREVVNNTNDKIKFERNNNTSKIIIEPGVYQFIFVYEFVPVDDYQNPSAILPPACQFSPYFVDFPAGKNDGVGNPMLVRLNSNCVHEGEAWSNHGETIDYVALITERTEWTVKFGLGNARVDSDQYGNPITCVRNYLGQIVGVRGFIMPNVSTFLYILKLGDDEH